MVSANELPWSLLGLPDEFALDHFTLALDTREPDPLEPLEVVCGELLDGRKQVGVAGGLRCPTIFGDLCEHNRFGWAKLHSTCVHPLALVRAPAWLSRRTALASESLRAIACHERWVVIDAASDSGVEVGSVFDVGEADELRDEPIELATGAIAIDRLLARRGHPAISLTRIRVLPIGLRPLGVEPRVASDLDELYRRVVNRGFRLRRLLELDAPEIILRNENIMTQAALEQLFCNEWREPIVSDDDRSTRDGPLVFAEHVVESLLGSVASTLADSLLEFDAMTKNPEAPAWAEPMPERIVRALRVIQALQLELRSR